MTFEDTARKEFSQHLSSPQLSWNDWEYKAFQLFKYLNPVQLNYFMFFFSENKIYSYVDDKKIFFVKFDFLGFPLDFHHNPVEFQDFFYFLLVF